MKEVRLWRTWAWWKFFKSTESTAMGLASCATTKIVVEIRNIISPRFAMTVIFDVFSINIMAVLQ
jgi:hypothetical protein